MANCSIFAPKSFTSRTAPPALCYPSNTHFALPFCRRRTGTSPRAHPLTGFLGPSSHSPARAAKCLLCRSRLPCPWSPWSPAAEGSSPPVCIGRGAFVAAHPLPSPQPRSPLLWRSLWGDLSGNQRLCHFCSSERTLERAMTKDKAALVLFIPQQKSPAPTRQKEILPLSPRSSQGRGSPGRAGATAPGPLPPSSCTSSLPEAGGYCCRGRHIHRFLSLLPP